jgi:predicted metal-binding membrane protein
MAALRRCRAPDCDVLLAGSMFGSGWSYGFKQGRACAICCAAPMLALLVLGAMNPTVMVLIAAVIGMEKLLPWPEQTARVFGVVAFLAGTGFIARAMLLH